MALIRPTQRLEDCDLVLDQDRIGRGHGCVGRDQSLFGGQEIEVAERAGEKLIVGHRERTMRLRLRIGQRLTIVERGPIESERLFGFLQRVQDYGVECGQFSGCV